MKFNKINEFKEICKMSQMQLKAWLAKWLSKYYEDVVNEDGFLYAEGADSILLTAHMDTVHKRQCNKITVKKRDGKTILSSKDGIGGDDRCGIYMIMRIIKETNLRPYVLFCEDEEIGGVGSDKFCMTNYVNELTDCCLFLIELDRANANDLIYYDDANEDFHDFCETVTGYKESYGSFSDISNLSPTCGVSSVNISCGYYNAHTRDEYVVFEEMEKSIEATIALMKEGIARRKQYEYEYHRLNSFERRWYETLYGSSYEYDLDKEEKEDAQDSNLVHYQFEDVNGNVYDEVECEGFYEAVGKLMLHNPDIRWNDIVDYESY